MKRNRALSLLLSCILLAGCSKQPEVSQTTSTAESLPAGDFNFIDQRPQSVSSGYVHTEPDAPDNAGASGYRPGETTSSRDDGWLTEPPTSSSSSNTQDDSQSTPSEYVTQFEDLEGNASIRAGANVYLSVPESVLHRDRLLFDVFVNNILVECNKVTASEMYSKRVLEKIYEGRTFTVVDDNYFCIDSLGVTIWGRNFASELDSVRDANISYFNLGDITSASGSSLNYSCAKVVTKDMEFETELFYRAVYELDTGTPEEGVEAKGVLIYDKQTKAATTVVIQLNKSLAPDESNTINSLSESVRYSTQEPENLQSLC